MAVKSVPPFNVNSSGFTAYVVSIACNRITVREAGKPPTTDYLIAFPSSTDGPITVPIGEAHVFVDRRGTFQPGSTPFFLKTVTGSVNFEAKEDSD